MQFKNRNTKNYQKAVKLLKSDKCRCIICNSRIRLTGVLMMDVLANDIKGIKCIECISVYDTDFEIQEIGICYNKGQA